MTRQADSSSANAGGYIYSIYFEASEMAYNVTVADISISGHIDNNCITDSSPTADIFSSPQPEYAAAWLYSEFKTYEQFTTTNLPLAYSSDSSMKLCTTVSQPKSSLCTRLTATCGP